jgi:hypothetical protein
MNDAGFFSFSFFCWISSKVYSYEEICNVHIDHVYTTFRITNDEELQMKREKESTKSTIEVRKEAKMGWSIF